MIIFSFDYFVIVMAIKGLMTLGIIMQVRKYRQLHIAQEYDCVLLEGMNILKYIVKTP